jgi:hypothetical protein
MSEYVLLVNNEYSPANGSKVANKQEVAVALGLEYSEDMTISPSTGWVELTVEDIPTPTSKYQIITSAIENVDDVWTKTFSITDGDEDHRRNVDTRDTKFMRDKRNALLTQSDWTQMPDSPLSDAKKAEWATYRQALRDITDDELFPVYASWPVKPD